MRTLFKVFILLLDEIAVVGLVLFILWKVGIGLSPAIIIGVTVVMGIFAFVLFKLIADVQSRKPLTGREGMIGLNGKVVEPLNRVGLVQVCGELWKASSIDGTTITVDETVTVVDVEGLRLLVRRRSNDELGNDVV